MLDCADGNPETPFDPEEARPQLARLNRDLLGAAKTLTDREARYLVDCYYQMQEDRIRADARVREMSAGGEPCRLLDRYGEQAGVLERQLVRALDGYAEAQPIGRWCKGIVGIGPLLSGTVFASQCELELGQRRQGERSLPPLDSADKGWHLYAMKEGVSDRCEEVCRGFLCFGRPFSRRLVPARAGGG